MEVLFILSKEGACPSPMAFSAHLYRYGRHNASFKFIECHFYTQPVQLSDVTCSMDSNVRVCQVLPKIYNGHSTLLKLVLFL